MKARKRVGIDIGSVSLKTVLIDDSNRLLFESYQRHRGRPIEALITALTEIYDKFPSDQMYDVGVTGSGRDFFSKLTGAISINEIVAQANAILSYYPDVATIIEIGGQDSKFIQLGKVKDQTNSLILNQKMNDICAAGTGNFIDQQAERMKIPVEQFGQLAVRADNPATIAGRCAVFAKTDIVHLRQEGNTDINIAAGICNAIARNYFAQLSKGKKLDTPIAFCGGLAANQGIIKAFKEMLNIAGDDFFVPHHFKVTGALGAALLSRENMQNDLSNNTNCMTIKSLLETIKRFHSENRYTPISATFLPPLKEKHEKIETFQILTENLKTEKLFLGIDVGSTSTCIAAINAKDELIAKTYTLNKSSLIESVNTALEGLRKQLEDKLEQIEVAGVGVTGSGRHLIAKYVGADYIKDEITAQVKVAVKMLPDVGTIFEIGGQDSKYMQISNGRAVAFEMNKVCAAGTGSFLQEQADRLNVKIGDLSRLAFASQHPVNLGSRCTVFMESDLITFQQSGTPKNDIIAGLCYSLAMNYLEKVVAGKPITDKILLLGGIAFNHGVIAAFQQQLNKTVFVPEHHEVSAAIGMALIAKEETKNRENFQSNFKDFGCSREKYDMTDFNCDDCQNRCRITKIITHDNTFCHGGVCSKYESKDVGVTTPSSNRNLPDIFKAREDLLLNHVRPESGRKKIGIPRSLLFFEIFPLWCTFLQELGYDIVLSDPTNRHIVNDGLELTSIDNCFSCKIAYGHIQNLVNKKVDILFFPSIIEFERRVKDIPRNYACPHIQGIPSILKASFPSIEHLTPVFVRNKDENDWKTELVKLGEKLGKTKQHVMRAIRAADRAQRSFNTARERLGKNYLKNLPADQKVFIIMGKVYNVCDPSLNQNIAVKLKKYGIGALPYDCLPLSEQVLPPNYTDMVLSSGQDLIRASGIIMQDERLYPVLITNFGCGPDSFSVKYLNEIFKNRSFLTLEVDEHTSDVGTLTRIEAFINTIQQNKIEDFETISLNFQPFIPSKTFKKFNKLLYIPIGFDSYLPIGAAFESIGIKTKQLPLHDEETERYGRMYTSGSECLPYIMHVGDAVRMTQDPDFDPEKSALFLPASDLSCRISSFPTSMKLVLRDLGFPQVPIIAPRLSLDTDEMLNVFGLKFVKNLFNGMLSIELLARMLTETRPYELHSGTTDKVYEQGIHAICRSLIHGNFWETLPNVIRQLENIPLCANPGDRPIIGLIGDDYTRGNSYANNDFIKEVENMGGEIWTVPIWSSYLEFVMGMKPKRMLRRKQYGHFVLDSVKAIIGKIDINKIKQMFTGKIKCYPDPTFSEMIENSAKYIDEKSEPLVLIALSHAQHLLRHKIDGIANLIGFQCMIHSVIAANLKTIYNEHGNLPTLNLIYDFQENVHQKNRIEAFLYQAGQYKMANDFKDKPNVA
jgi:predicted CoA-substrate-specific enzyme activase